MNKPFHGILELDYPKLSDEELRAVQLENPETHLLPDGKTVAEYARLVEELKAERLAEIEKSKAPKPKHTLKKKDEVPATPPKI